MAKKGTRVPRLSQRAIQLTTNSLERIHPALAVGLATRLWFYTGQPPAAERRNRHPIAAGTPFEVELHAKPVRGLQWGPDNAPLAYLVHGWGGWWQQLGSFVPVLLDLGYRVVAFDALGHGDSGAGIHGRRSSSVPEMAESYQAVVDRLGTPAATVAHSMGCLSVMWAQRQHRVVPDRQVLIAPAASTQGMLDIFGRSLGLGEPTLKRLVDRLPARIGQPLSDFDLLPLVALEEAERGLAPALIIHDRDDPMTSPAESEVLAGQWPQADLLLTDGYGHYRVLRADETLTRTAGFLRQA